MAKGLGAIMAAVSIAHTKCALDNGEALVCPICGNKMETGVSYFCYGSGEQDAYGKRHPCVETTHTHVKEAFMASFKGYGAYDEWEHTLIAAVVDQTDPQLPVILAELRTVRGPAGMTNLSATVSYGNDYTIADLPKLVKQFGWIFQDWYPGE